jgi:hypothetical protein
MLKLWLLFVLDLAAVVCALRAFTDKSVYLAPNGDPFAWKNSDASGFLIVGCSCALAALLVAVLM